MPITWDDRKTIYRLTGIAEELLVSSRTAHDPASVEAAGRQLAPIAREIHALLAANDGALADEFARVVLTSERELPVDIRAATLVGWLRAGNAVEVADEERRVRVEHVPARRKPIGFRLRTLIGGEASQEEDAARDDARPPEP